MAVVAGLEFPVAVMRWALVDKMNKFFTFALMCLTLMITPVLKAVPITITDANGHTVTITPPSEQPNVASPSNTDELIIVRPGVGNFQTSIQQFRLFIGTNNYPFTLSSSNGFWTQSVSGGVTNYDYSITNITGLNPFTNGSVIPQGVTFNNATLTISNIVGSVTTNLQFSLGTARTNTLYWTNGILFKVTNP